MYEPLNSWLTQQAQAPGILAASLNYPDQSRFNQTKTPDLPDHKLNETWQRLAGACQGFHLHRIQPTQMRWNYENAVLHFVLRNDGISLGLVTGTGLAAPEPDLLQDLILQFLTLHTATDQSP